MYKRKSNSSRSLLRKVCVKEKVIFFDKIFFSTDEKCCFVKVRLFLILVVFRVGLVHGVMVLLGVARGDAIRLEIVKSIALEAPLK